MGLIDRYNKCFEYYRDFTCLLAVAAMSGLLVAISRWESSFEQRGISKKDDQQVLWPVVRLMDLLALVALFAKHYFHLQWKDYKDPVSFHK